MFSGMPINASPEYLKAEKEYLRALSLDDKIYWLEEMVRRVPSHKGGENLRAELRTRLKKFREKAEKAKKKAGGRKGIRKEGFQFVLIGLPGRGKSSLLAGLTNAKPKISAYGFTTTHSELGTFVYQDVKAQMIDVPSIGSENFDIGLANTADCLILVVVDLRELKEIEKILFRAPGKRIVVINKVDLLNPRELRKVKDRMKSKRIHGVVVSALKGYGLDELRERLFLEMDVIRVFMKEPGKVKSKIPMVLHEGSSVRDVAEHILKGLSFRIKESRLTGPSSKFSNQRVGLNHVLKDLDVIEFHTR